MKLLLIFVGFETKVLLSFGKKSPCSTRLKLSKLKKDFINREFQHVHLRCKQVPRNESWTLLLQLRVGKKEVRQAYVRTVSLSAGFEPTRENPNRFRVCRLNHSATTTWVLILPLSDYICSCISKKWGIERFWYTDVSICRKIIYSLEGFIFGKYRKNTRLKFLSQTILWWARKVYSNTIRKFWACSAQWKSMTLIAFTTGRKQRLNRNFCVISNFRGRHDLNMRGKIPTDF